MKIKKSLLHITLIGFVFASAPFAWAKQQVLQDLTYSQRLSTKLVDINYRLFLEAGQTAEVTFTFSHDNGLTFPVECRSVTGDVGKGMTSGNKSAVWDAGVDWPLKFTEQGRMKATCMVSGDKGLDYGLVAYYPFNGDARDMSGNHNHGHVHGATLTTDRHGQANSAYSFDGTNDYISVDNDFGKEVTISIWAENSSPDRSSMAWCFGSHGPDLLFSLKTISLNTWDSRQNAFGNYLPANKKWCNFVTILSPEESRQYIDGQKFGSAKYRSPSGKEFYISMKRPWHDKNDYAWVGSLDDIRIYNRALSESEVGRLYEMEKVVEPPVVVEPPAVSHKPIPFEVVSVPLGTSEIANSPTSILNYWINDDLSKHEIISRRPKSYVVAKYEVTNNQWNEVADWSANRGYDLITVDYESGEGNLPRTNVAIKEVIKWLNALSEKQGLIPVFYLDPIEPRWDQNGDGKFTLGSDSFYGGEEAGDHDYTWDPNFDWSLIPNGKKHITGGSIEFDPNFNGKWDEGEPFYDRNRNGFFDSGDSLFGGNEPGDHDYKWDSNFDWSLIPNGKENLFGGWIEPDPNFNGVWDEGEPFYDRNRNGIFEPMEFLDLNKNGKLDDGLTEVCRSGNISDIERFLGGFSLRLHTNLNANGYGLPKTIDWQTSEAHFLAMGGHESSEWGEYWPIEPRPPMENPKQGLVFKDEWPWGNQSPENKEDIDKYAITPFGKFSALQEVGLTKGNGYDIFDMVGNAREYLLHWEKGELPELFGQRLELKEVLAYGGSFSSGFEKRENWDSNSGEIIPSEPHEVMSPSPESWFRDLNPVSPNGNPDVGFRPVRWTF